MAQDYENIVRCPDQLLCMQNRSYIIMVALLSQFQSALQQNFLSYMSNPNFYGEDSLRIWISDQGFTDQSYRNVRTASSAIRIVVLPVNDPPVITIPTTLAGIQYVTDMACRVDFMNPYSNSSFPATLDGLDCPYPASSALPPSTLVPISVADRDVDDVSYGNLSVNLQIQAANSGQLYIEANGKGEIGAIADLTYYERTNEDGTTTLTLWGKMANINHVLRHIFFDCEGGFSGYAPISITVRSLR